ncbi:hypothetical protein WOLCODRAFT_89558 [Wolfiporia cocos MD-104 SS10]|uniref:Uncharacterized protein n=1 Tax=Wolfiporia cocos (strain MD-104) TaxID=742152 RepID=A0A2H3JJE3_WOLCO|nr:hypothetical protein WOLCODRAFT_89558 [Wolfiporia cocos MD-104 SS10]
MVPALSSWATGHNESVDPLRLTSIISSDLQWVLWDLPHKCTDNHPGKLTLCLGLPVMIKTNEATECCVTNGAEGVDEKLALDTLFVCMTSPPTPIQLKGLPENVVPITHQAMKVTCKMLNDEMLTILHVAVIPNFAMTDFGSQRHMSHNNVCDLQNCKTHQSTYTYLSWGSTYEGTIIVQGFDTNKLTGGITGSLRQESCIVHCNSQSQTHMSLLNQLKTAHGRK